MSKLNAPCLFWNSLVKLGVCERFNFSSVNASRKPQNLDSRSQAHSGSSMIPKSSGYSELAECNSQGLLPNTEILRLKLIITI